MYTFTQTKREVQEHKSNICTKVKIMFASFIIEITFSTSHSSSQSSVHLPKILSVYKAKNITNT